MEKRGQIEKSIDNTIYEGYTASNTSVKIRNRLKKIYS